MYYVLYLVQCQAVRGVLDASGSGITHLLGKTPTANDCAVLVKRINPLAKGMTYYQEDKRCWEGDGRVVPSASVDFFSCVFDGKSIEV